MGTIDPVGTLFVQSSRDNTTNWYTTNAVVLFPPSIPYLCVMQFQGNTSGYKEKKTLHQGCVTELNFTGVTAAIPTGSVWEY